MTSTIFYEMDMGYRNAAPSILAVGLRNGIVEQFQLKKAILTDGQRATFSYVNFGNSGFYIFKQVASRDTFVMIMNGMLLRRKGQLSSEEASTLNEGERFSSLRNNQDLLRKVKELFNTFTPLKPISTLDSRIPYGINEVAIKGDYLESPLGLATSLSGGRKGNDQETAILRQAFRHPQIDIEDAASMAQKNLLYRENSPPLEDIADNMNQVNLN